MARKKSGFTNLRSVGLVCGVAAAFAGGGYYVGKNGAPPAPERVAGLLDKAGVETAKAEARAEQAGAAFLTKLTSAAAELKPGAATKSAEKGGRNKAPKVQSARTDDAKTRIASAKSDSAKSDSAKSDSVKSGPTKPETTKADAEKAASRSAEKTKAASKAVATKEPAAPVPPAPIAETPKAEAQKPEAQKIVTAKAEAPKPNAEDVTNTTPKMDALKTNTPLSASLLNKGIPTSEDSRIRLSVNFENRTGKPIRAFEGVLKFTDAQDHSLFSSKISVSALISDNGKLQWDERVDPEKLDAMGKKIVDADKENLKAVFVPRKVFFVDGSVQKFGG